MQSVIWGIVYSGDGLVVMIPSVVLDVGGLRVEPNQPPPKLSIYKKGKEKKKMIVDHIYIYMQYHYTRICSGKLYD